MMSRDQFKFCNIKYPIIRYGLVLSSTSSLLLHYDPIIIPTKEAYAKQTVDPQKLIINFISEVLYDY